MSEHMTLVMTRGVTTTLATNYAELSIAFADVLAEDFTGFRCGRGWIGPVRALFGAWRYVCDPHTIRGVCEHGGHLEVQYCSPASMLAPNMVEYAVIRADNTCEVCGQYGVFVDVDGWPRVRCRRHSNVVIH